MVTNGEARGEGARKRGGNGPGESERATVTSDLVERLPGVFVHPSADVELPATIGAGSRIWRFCHVMRGARLGRQVSLGQGCFVAHGAVLGDRVRVQNGVSLFSGVILEADVFVGPGVVFTNVKNPRVERPRPGDFQRTLVGRGASIGANATLLPGIAVGPHAFVGAGAVVTRDVGAYELALGNPARVVGWMSAAGERLVFDGEGRACCATSGERYRLVAGCVERE